MSELTLTIPKGKYSKKAVKLDDEIKLYNYLIQIYCVMENKNLPFAERMLLAYYAKYGITNEASEKYIEDFNRNKQIVSNLKYQLTQKEFLFKHENLNVHELPPFLKQKRDTLTIIIELDAKL